MILKLHTHRPLCPEKLANDNEFTLRFKFYNQSKLFYGRLFKLT